MNDLLPRSSGEVVATLRSRLGTPMRWTVGPIVRTVNKTAVKLVSYNLAPKMDYITVAQSRQMSAGIASAAPTVPIGHWVH